MLCSQRTLRAFCLSFCATPFFLASTALADISATGEVSPTNPATWTSSTIGQIGINNGNMGTLTVNLGSDLLSQLGYLGYYSGSTGTATVTGNGSTWTNSYELYVGYYGTGNLTISSGGQVSNTYGYLGYNSGSTGTATVTGNGSTWNNTSNLNVGYSGTGNLTIADGGKVTARTLSINSLSTLNLRVSGNNLLVSGNTTFVGSITNNGKINLYADSFMSSGIYTPISEYAGRAMTWSGSGTYNAFGGTWNSGNHTFAVSAATPLAEGATDILSDYERLLIAGGLEQVGASFGSGAAGRTFSANLATVAERNSLQALLPTDESVLSAWNFNTNLSGNTVLLSFNVGTGASNLKAWHYDGSAWTSYAAGDLNYGSDGTASFTVNSFSGYAVTGMQVVPEPATLSLLGVGFLGLIRRRRRSA